ncbi:hypothetical protein [Pseudogracilibacillus sp. ICA-222130]|uniref:hypothetical protein n=1 Tax=Pseudogracilibacillus sp. ICA-222130 TaxID=3134655 RepID=UPI0030C4F9A1
MDFPVYTILLFTGLLYGMITFMIELRHYNDALNVKQLTLSIVIMIISVIGLYVSY